MPLLATSDFIVVTSEVPELPAIFYSIFSRHILSKPEATCRLPQTLIIYEPNNSDCEPKTPNHCLGPKVHRLNLELALI